MKIQKKKLLEKANERTLSSEDLNEILSYKDKNNSLPLSSEVIDSLKIIKIILQKMETEKNDFLFEEEGQRISESSLNREMITEILAQINGIGVEIININEDMPCIHVTDEKKFYGEICETLKETLLE